MASLFINCDLTIYKQIEANTIKKERYLMTRQYNINVFDKYIFLK